MKKSLIFKSNDRTNLSDYRPISLTNTDYKILAFILSLRLQKVLYKIINTDQTGYIKKRYIGTNIRLIDDIIDYTEKFNKPGVLLFLDFRKAFDSLEWDFLHKVLEKFGFGESFRKWVNIIYK